MTLKSDCIVHALQGSLSSNVFSYLCEMYAGGENHRLPLLSTTLQSCQHCVYCLEFSQYSVLRISVCSLPLAMFCFLQPTYFTMELARQMASLNRIEDSKTYKTSFYLAPHSLLMCICRTHAHCGCFW